MSSQHSHHPYNPRNLKLPQYVPNDKGALELVLVFFLAVALVLFVTVICTASVRSKVQRAVLCWFSACGAIHIILEGYFAFYSADILRGGGYLDQMWKEFGKGDSRYVTSDTCMLSVEGLTAVLIGPLCFLTVLAFLRNSPLRYVLQMIVSVSHMYGTTIYFTAETIDGFIHGELWHPLYFWFYVAFLNSIWIVVPCLLIVQASFKIREAQASLDKNISKGSKKKK